MTGTSARIDVRGMACSDAVVKLHKTLMPMGAGGAVVVVADNEDVVIDLRKYAARAGHRWVREQARGHGVVEAEVQRGE
jgi:TusA-related sulfurtransferase